VTRLLSQLLLATEQHRQTRQLLDHYASLLDGEKVSRGEVRSHLAEFPRKPPAGGWLKA
jgi:hypothetical protein